MTSDNLDYFAHKANKYESEQARVNNVTKIANLILKEIAFTKEMNVMDYGSGTGLLLSKIAPYVKSITAVDISKSMNKVLASKMNNIPCDIVIQEVDILKTRLDVKFDNIISSMTIHHIKDTKKLFKRFYNLLDYGGTIALSDLDTEDGTFHKEDTGVYHFGFNRNEFINIAESVGFKDVKIQTVGNVIKPYGEYGVFLMTAIK